MGESVRFHAERYSTVGYCDGSSCTVVPQLGEYSR